MMAGLWHHDGSPRNTPRLQPHLQWCYYLANGGRWQARRTPITMSVLCKGTVVPAWTWLCALWQSPGSICPRKIQQEKLHVFARQQQGA